MERTERTRGVGPGSDEGGSFPNSVCRVKADFRLFDPWGAISAVPGPSTPIAAAGVLR